MKWGLGRAVATALREGANPTPAEPTAADKAAAEQSILAELWKPRGVRYLARRANWPGSIGQLDELLRTMHAQGLVKHDGPSGTRWRKVARKA